MTSRREFLQAAAISGVIAGTAGTATMAATRRPLAAVVIDERFAQACILGSRLADGGTPVLGISDGDITQIWLREIGPMWKRQPAAVAGLTARPALFCLEELALPHGLRVVFHAEHIVHPDGIAHTILRGSEEAHCFPDDLNRAGNRWPERIAQALSTHQLIAHARVGPSDAALEPPLPEGAQLLTSWLIAAV